MHIEEPQASGSMSVMISIIIINLYMGVADALNFFIAATPVLHFIVVSLSLVFLIYDRWKKFKHRRNF